MTNLSNLKLLFKTYRSDLGVFMLRMALTFVFIAHSANLLMGVLPEGLTTISEVEIFIFAIIELISAIMILSGFLVSIASYILFAIVLYYTITVCDTASPFLSDKNNTYALLVMASTIALALVGPGKFVLNKRYGHIATSLREEGIDKEVEIMGT